MGERGNIVVDGIWLYTHWSGDNIKVILQNALKKKWRWQDSAYLTRIIFCEMIKDDIEGETGYGISLHMCDNEYPILFVETEDQKVYLKTEDKKTILNVWTFEEYIKSDFSEVKNE
jgi:hypothetical protein